MMSSYSSIPQKKKYGLIIPSKVKETAKEFRTRKFNPLQDSDDELEKEEEETALDWVEQSFKKSAGNAGLQSLQKRRIREAFEEDSTIFQYDEVYDDIKQSAQKNKQKSQEKKPKYIGTILKHAEKRKIENERRQERKVQKERDAEGDEFKDKEAFVTSSYLKKLEELKKAEEEEKREKLMEEAVDVHKHKNFGVFYSHLFEQRMGGETSAIKEENHSSDEKEKDSSVSKTTFNKSKEDSSRKKVYRTQKDDSQSPDRGSRNPSPKRRHRSSSHSSRSEKEMSPDEHRRQYRERAKARDKESKKKRRSRSTSRYRRRSSPRSRKRSTSRSRKRSTSRNRKRDTSRTRKRSRSRKRSSSRSRKRSNSQSRKRSTSRSRKKSDVSDTRNKPAEVKTEEKKPISVKELPIEERIAKYQITFAKITVGQVFKDALKRYFERKALNDS